MVYGDGFENRSPEREAQVRILYPPLECGANPCPPSLRSGAGRQVTPSAGPREIVSLLLYETKYIYFPWDRRKSGRKLVSMA